MSYKKGLKPFIKNLPGPHSYCKCDKLCSRLEVEHVIPKMILKTGFDFNVSKKDPHNLYKCCSRINRDKGHKLFGKDFVLDNSYHKGALSRSCLYMYETYKLPIDKKVVSIWRHLHKEYPPHPFEIQRDILIQKFCNTRNYFLDDYSVNFDEYDKEDDYWD
jgi:endonuclease I